MYNLEVDGYIYETETIKEIMMLLDFDYQLELETIKESLRTGYLNFVITELKEKGYEVKIKGVIQ